MLLPRCCLSAKIQNKYMTLGYRFNFSHWQQLTNFTIQNTTNKTGRNTTGPAVQLEL